MRLDDLVAQEFDDPELMPEILPVEARVAINVSTAGLHAALQRTAAVATASADKEVIAGTSYVLLEALHASSQTVAYLRLTSSDAKTMVSVNVDAGVDVRRAGVVLLPAHRMRDIMKLAPSERVYIEVIGGVATVRSGRALWHVRAGTGDELTSALRVSSPSIGAVPLQGFREALSAVRRAASTSEARNSLMQIQLRNGAFTACDGGRVHRARVRGLHESLNVSIPVGAVDEILRASGTATSAEFGYDERHIVFETDNDRIVAQRLVTPFPESVETLILGPAVGNHDALRVDRRELLETVRRVRINANPDSAAITLSLVAARDLRAGANWHLGVSARDSAGNSAQEELPVSWEGARNFGDITVNHGSLIDLLEVYRVDEIVFQIGVNNRGTRTPLFVEDDEQGWTAVIAQMFSA